MIGIPVLQPKRIKDEVDKHPGVYQRIKIAGIIFHIVPLSEILILKLFILKMKDDFKVQSRVTHTWK